MENRLTLIIFDVAARLKVPAIIIGGLALPAYEVGRTTLDIDICIHVNSQERLNQFVGKLKEENIQTLQVPKVDHDLFLVFGKNNEAEIWLKPCDAFNWDERMLERLQAYFANVKVLAVEDFIMTKLARSDRSSVDIDDILQILINNYKRIDWEYLQYRLRWIDLQEDFEEIVRGLKLVSNQDHRVTAQKILDKLDLH